MTAKGLLEYFERYYGEKYSGVFLDTMLNYLEGYSDDFYKAVAEVMVKRFSRIFNKVPGVAEIEKHLEEIYEMIPEPVSLPEPRHIITDEERAECEELASECMRMLVGKRGPLTQAFKNVFVKPIPVYE